MAARIIQMHGFRDSGSPVREAPDSYAPGTPPRPSYDPATLREGSREPADVGRAPARALPIADTDAERPVLSPAMRQLCKALPTAPIDLKERAQPRLIVPVTVPGMPPAVGSPPPPFHTAESIPPDTEVERATDSSELGRGAEGGAPPSALAERNRAVLLRLDGAHAGQLSTLSGDSLQLGRHPTAQLSIQDGSVSRIHARIYRQHDAWWIEDLGSRNGTYVQGRRVDHCILEDGDWVQLGSRSSFRFTYLDAKQEQVMRRLYDSSVRDALTGAYSRQHFDERLRGEVAYALRHGTELSLIMLDLDRFKRVNDAYGHQAGDAVLRYVAGAAQLRLRTEDVLARYGGEEFAVILRGIGLRGAARAAERLRVAMASSAVFFAGQTIPVSLSAGCASLECSEERSPTELIAVADRRLYLAKRAGRNRVVYEDYQPDGG